MQGDSHRNHKQKSSKNIKKTQQNSAKLSKTAKKDFD
jgi:hypothetical protein